MYREEIFDQIKEVMVHELQKVRVQDFNRYYEWVQPHYEVLERIAKLPILELQQEAESVKEHTEEAPVISENYPIGHTFTFVQKAYGGVIHGLNYPIPEDLVRAMQLENGNTIKITRIKGYFDEGSPIYDFAVEDSHYVENPLLAEVKHGIVEEVGRRLLVTESSKGLIKVNGEPAVLYINSKDAERFKVKKGDVIDGRFYTNNVIGSFRVTHKHDTARQEQASIESRMLHHRQNTQDESESGLSMIDRLDTTPFLNKKILLIGLAGRINDFKMHLSKTDIDFTHLTGDEHKQSIRSKILKADYVLLSTYENSHDATKYSAVLCNEYYVPCKSTSADGLFGVLMDAKELIDQVEKEEAAAV